MDTGTRVRIVDGPTTDEFTRPLIGQQGTVIEASERAHEGYDVAVRMDRGEAAILESVEAVGGPALRDMVQEDTPDEWRGVVHVAPTDIEAVEEDTVNA